MNVNEPNPYQAPASTPRPRPDSGGIVGTIAAIICFPACFLFMPALIASLGVMLDLGKFSASIGGIAALLVAGRSFFHGRWSLAIGSVIVAVVLLAWLVWSFVNLSSTSVSATMMGYDRSIVSDRRGPASEPTMPG